MSKNNQNIGDYKGIITFSRFGNYGRFANQVFQYAFLKLYAKKHNLKLQLPYWIGQYLFGHNDEPVSGDFKKINDIVSNDSSYLAKDSPIAGSAHPIINADISGYFQYHTSYYAPNKDFFRSLFCPIGEAKEVTDRLIEKLKSKGKTIISLHLRRGDYGTFSAPSSRCFFVAPSSWYLDWLKQNWGRFESPVLYIASDELKKVLSDFSSYNPETSESLGIHLPKAPYYPDFFALSQSDVLCISNSSFSFVASMLNTHCKEFYRPRLSIKKLISYDPWSSHTIFRDERY